MEKEKKLDVPAVFDSVDDIISLLKSARSAGYTHARTNVEQYEDDDLRTRLELDIRLVLPVQETDTGS